jgi:hypothetical protein
MEAGTQETGCNFKEHTGETCRKLTETGSLMCPYHNLLVEHRQKEKEKREATAKKRGRR